MWEQSFEKIYPEIKKEDVWKVWSDVKGWPQWDTDLEYCDMKEPFISGSSFILKPFKGPKVKIILTKVIREEIFSNICSFPGAVMQHTHKLAQEENGVKITHTIKIAGLLSFIWRRLVAQKVADSVPIQTDNLITYLKENNEKVSI